MTNSLPSADVTSHAVETVTLDQVLLAPDRQRDRVAFINIDAEGHELAVLRGGEGLINSHRPVLLVEVEYRHGSAVAEVFDWLRARRYAPRVLTNEGNLEPIDPAGLRKLQDQEQLARRLAGDRHAGYVNNIFFLPEN